MKILQYKKIWIFALITLVAVILTVSLVIMDEQKQRRKDLEVLRQGYLKRLVEMQATQTTAAGKGKNFDDLKKGLPDVAKVEHDFKN
ncbi:MAG: hypothetical protein PHW46_03880 [Candidatus Omnitrophica bacterium]|nr:hypothetical protein [Candidatus Omnitrophota bacterium]